MRTLGLIGFYSKIKTEEFNYADSHRNDGDNRRESSNCFRRRITGNAPSRVRVIVLYDENAPNGNSKKRRRARSAEGLIKMSANFDAPLEDFEEYQP